MTAALIGMIICGKKQNSTPLFKKKLAGGLLVVVIVCAISLFVHLNSDIRGNEISNRHSGFYRVAGISMGRELARQTPGGKILLIHQQGYEKIDQEKAVFKGLKEGLDGKLEIAAIETIKISPSECVSAKQLDALIQQHPDCNVVLTMIGLPNDVGEMKIWQRPTGKRPKIAVLKGQAYFIRAVEGGAINAMVCHKPNPNLNQEVPTDPQAAFDMVYVMVTPENIVKIKKQYPKLFK